MFYLPMFQTILSWHVGCACVAFLLHRDNSPVWVCHVFMFSQSILRASFLRRCDHCCWDSCGNVRERCCNYFWSTVYRRWSPPSLEVGRPCVCSTVYRRWSPPSLKVGRPCVCSTVYRRWSPPSLKVDSPCVCSTVYRRWSPPSLKVDRPCVCSTVYRRWSPPSLKVDRPCVCSQTSTYYILRWHTSYELCWNYRVSMLWPK